MTTRIEALMRRVGIEPGTPYDAPTPDDVNAWQVDEVTSRLAAATPVPFNHADHPLHPGVSAWVGNYLFDPVACPSLVLIGITGTGKTYNAWKALRAAVIGSYKARCHATWAAVTHPAFNAQTRSFAGDVHEGTLRRLAGRDLLVFDDLGASKGTDWSAECLLRLMDDRFAAGHPTIWTTNVRSEAELTERMGDRVTSRLNQAEWVVFDGPDHRRSAP